MGVAKPGLGPGPGPGDGPGYRGVPGPGPVLLSPCPGPCGFSESGVGNDAVSGSRVDDEAPHLVFHAA